MPPAGGTVAQITRGNRTRTGYSFSQAWDRIAFASADAALYTGQTLGPNSGHVML